MHGQGNYTTQIGQDPFARPPAFQQHPAAPTTSSTSYYGPHAPQPQVYQQGRPSFHPTLSFNAFHHAPPSVPHQGPPAPVVSGGLSSVPSYLPHPRPPHMNTQITHSYPSSEQHSLPWSRNAHQLPPAPPLPGPSVQLPSSQGHALERAPPLPPQSHATPPSLPPYSSSSSAFMSDPFRTSVLPMREHSHQQSMAPVLPPPPPPPPPSSPPGVPPIPPSSPPSDIISKRDGGRSLKGLFNGNDLLNECPTPVEYKSAHDTDVSFQQAEKSGTEVGPAESVVAHSPVDSDMDMEDDITHPDEEKNNKSSVNSNDEFVSKSVEDYAKEQLQSLQHAGGHSLPKNVVHGNLLFAEDSESKVERGGSEVASDCNLPVTLKVTTEADDSGVSVNQTEHPSSVGVEDFPSQFKNLSQPCVPVLSSENGVGKPPDQAMEGENPFKLLQDYTSDNTSETDEEIVTNVGSHCANDGSTNFDAEKELALRHETVTESNQHIPSKLMVESPRNVMQADKLSVPTHTIEEISDRSHRDQEPVYTLTGAHQLKDSKIYDDNIGLEGAKLHKLDTKSNSSKLNVDEFGRLVREGVSDSDTSGSPHHASRHARKTRKRSRSRSPHDRRRRRRRSPRRKERHSRSRSLSPKRRRSRSRSPVLRRDSEFGENKVRWEKGHIPDCFDFRRGKCYRGATCRYSHHELDKSERSRYNRGKQYHRDALPDLQSPDFHEESKALPDQKVKDKGLELPQDMPGSREAKDVERLPLDFSTDSPIKDQSFVPEAAAPYSDEIPQTVHQQGKRADDTPVSESSTPVHAFSARSTLHPDDKPDAKPYSSEDVSLQSLKEPVPSIANHSPQLTVPFSSALQAVSAPFAQPITPDYNFKPPISWNHMIPQNNSPYQAPVAYQHSYFPGPSKSLLSSFLPLSLPPPPPPPLPPPPAGEHSISSQNMQQPSLPPWIGLSSVTSVRTQPTELSYRSQTGQYQGYSFAREPNQMPQSTDSFGSSSLHLTSRQGGPHITGEDRQSGHSVQGMNPSLAQSQPNSILMQSSLKGMHGSVAGGLPSDSISHSHPYFHQASYGMQYSGAGAVVPAQHSEPGTVNSSASRITLDFIERNRPSYVHDFAESRNSNYFKAYASNFDLPSSKFSSNALIQENNTTIKTNYSAPLGLAPVPFDEHMTKDASVLPRPGGNQYDPYFDSIEPASNSYGKADYRKHETGDSDDVLRFSGSGRVLNMEGIKQEGKTAASVNDSLEKEECGETADVAVDAILDGTPSNHDDATDTDAGEVEIDQVKTSGKKKKRKERSMKHFKVSIATFVKEVLKPSWRQGNMSKEAFKTIVKKTVDKVSGAMKSHQIPKSQAKINHYIDSSRGKLTKLVMGYVDKYVKV